MWPYTLICAAGTYEYITTFVIRNLTVDMRTLVQCKQHLVNDIVD